MLCVGWNYVDHFEEGAKARPHVREMPSHPAFYEMPHPDNLRVTCRLNGVTKQDSNTTHLYFKIPRVVAEFSAGMTLEPGDVIATGTPAGVGHAPTPPEFMKAGDILETEIVGLGLLRNKIGG